MCLCLYVLSFAFRCTCPDFIKHRVHCKHIIFVFVKVLKLRDPLWFQAAFLNSVTSPTPTRHIRFLNVTGIRGDFCEGGG